MRNIGWGVVALFVSIVTFFPVKKIAIGVGMIVLVAACVYMGYMIGVSI